MQKSRLLKNLLFGSYTYGKPRSEEVKSKGPQRRHSSRMKPQPPPSCLLGWCFLPVSSSQLLHSWFVLSKTKYHECRTLCVSSYELDSGWHYFLETVPLWTGIRHAIPTMLASAHTSHDMSTIYPLEYFFCLFRGTVLNGVLPSINYGEFRTSSRSGPCWSEQPAQGARLVESPSNLQVEIAELHPMPAFQCLALVRSSRRELDVL